MAAVTVCSDFGAQENIVSPSICHEVMGPDAMILVFWMLSFKPTFYSPLLLSSRDSLVLLHFLNLIQSCCHSITGHQGLSHLMRRTVSLEKILMLGKIDDRRRRGQQDEMTGWHHRLNGHEFEWSPGVGDGQGSLVCCGPWGRKESDMTEQLNWTELTAASVEMFQDIIYYNKSQNILMTEYFISSKA